MEHIIDCDADPFVPGRLAVESHRKSGPLVFGPSRIKLYLPPGQRGGGYVAGPDLYRELASHPVANANVLDDLLAHPELIPGDWEDKLVFFWGTIYRYSKILLYVRYLYRDKGIWRSNHTHWLFYAWNSSHPAAVLAD